jgi:hypothetical protein
MFARSGCLFGGLTTRHPIDWTAVAAVVAALSLFALVFGQLLQGRRRGEDLRRQNFLLESEQARKVAGYLEVTGTTSNDLRIVQLWLVNESDLPVRAVKAIVRDVESHHDQLVNPVFMLYAHQRLKSLEMNFSLLEARSLYLVLEFDDDAGLRWLKYAHGRSVLERIPTTAVVANMIQGVD